MTLFKQRDSAQQLLSRQFSSRQTASRQTTSRRSAWQQKLARIAGLKAQKSRPLTSAEMALAYSVFGDGLDVSQVRLKTAWWVLKNYAVSPNGNIYFNPKDWVTDFSHESLSKQGWLIHELTHVWQLQQGLKVVRGALMNRKYEYAFEQGKSFFKYGIEQQARMVQDYFLRRELGKDCQAWQACIPFLQAPDP